ncbi:TRAP transporter substrate-binding protein [Parvularcula sp. IMCC14364]|uniref:TRAP transporter substrate-binding protein n=1 Tax=Parvularcula sp. IMCC14364 TaxID=3067902 RepID=UPI0027426FD6|nr:TRAP transporter substrate-binding protein [Parvularcula sp. IMCC14364]
MANTPDENSLPQNTTPSKRLNRRKFMTVGALGAATLAAGCECKERCGGPAVAEAGINGIADRELKMVTTWPRDFPGLGDGAENVARYITEMSGGKMRVTLYAAGELVGAFDSFDAVSGGSADLYHGAEYYWTSRSRAYAFFTSVPFGMTISEIMGWIEYGGGQQLWDELAGAYNIKPFGAGNTGHQMGGWFKNEINSLEDLRGLKIRMPGIGGEVMRRTGATAVSLPGNELYQALQSGAIDATEWVGPWNDIAFGFYREANFYYWPGFHEPGAMLSTGMNLELWNDLSLQEKAIVENACRAANHQMIAQYAHNNSIGLKTLIEEHDVQLRQMPEDVMEALARNTKIVFEEIAAEDDLSARIYDSYREALLAGAEWNRISDEAYMAVRRELLDL